MREIKFRFWDGKKMVFTEDINLNYAIKSHNVGEAPGLMQFTGLKDRQGKEIYEGDVVNVKIGEGKDEGDLFRGEVKFECPLGFVIGSRVMGIVYLIFKVELEIIGNIYENPELLTLKETK